MTHIIVVGDGVVGRSVAWRTARRGCSVTLVTGSPDEPAASWVAGGMLAPITEAWPGEQPVLEFGEAALDRWPEFAAELGDAGLRTEGTIAVAVDPADVREQQRLAAHLQTLGRKAEWLSAREIRRLEPSLGPAVRGGLSVPGDLAVDNRRLLVALADAGNRTSVRLVDGPATAARPGRVRLRDGRELTADVVVVAAGARSGHLHPALAGLIRPVHGEILRLRARSTSLPPPSRTVRAVVEGRPLYLVPRDAGRLVVGATQQERGFDPDVTVEGVRDLIHAAERIMPGVADYALTECSFGWRPATPDNLPLLGELEPGLLVATGDGRNGVLHAPLVAETVADLITGATPHPATSAAAPHRFLRDDHAEEPPPAGSSARSSRAGRRGP